VREQPASAGDADMAGSYAAELVVVSDKARTLHSWGASSPEEGGVDGHFSRSADGGILIFDKGWLKIDPKTGKSASIPAAASFLHQGIVSPSGKSLARVAEGKLFVDSIGPTPKTASWSSRGEISSVVWSPDSKRLAVVATLKKDDDVFLYDELVVLSAPD
jgi:hypothetical protein